MKYKTIVDKDGRYVVVIIHEIGKVYELGYGDVPELYPFDSTLEGIDRYYHGKLFGSFKDMGCKLINVKVNIDGEKNK